MKLRTKAFAGIATTIVALSMMASTAFAATPIFQYDNAAGAKEDMKSTVICELLSGGGNQDGFNGPVYDELQGIATEAASVDVLLTGKFTGTAHLNFVGDMGFTPDGTGYDNKTYANKEISVDGYLVYSGDFGPAEADARFAFLLRNKSEGEATLVAYILRNADGAIIGGMDGAGFLAAADAEALFNEVTGTAPAEEAVEEAAALDASADASVPKTGPESFGLIYGLGAAILGSGAVLLRRKVR